MSTFKTRLDSLRHPEFLALTQQEFRAGAAPLVGGFSGEPSATSVFSVPLSSAPFSSAPVAPAAPTVWRVPARLVSAPPSAMPVPETSAAPFPSEPEWNRPLSAPPQATRSPEPGAVSPQTVEASQVAPTPVAEAAVPASPISVSAVPFPSATQNETALFDERPAAPVSAPRADAAPLEPTTPALAPRLDSAVSHSPQELLTRAETVNPASASTLPQETDTTQTAADAPIRPAPRRATFREVLALNDLAQPEPEVAPIAPVPQATSQAGSANSDSDSAPASVPVQAAPIQIAPVQPVPLEEAAPLLAAALAAPAVSLASDAANVAEPQTAAAIQPLATSADMDPPTPAQAPEGQPEAPSDRAELREVSTPQVNVDPSPAAASPAPVSPPSVVAPDAPTQGPSPRTPAITTDTDSAASAAPAQAEQRETSEQQVEAAQSVEVAPEEPPSSADAVSSDEAAPPAAPAEQRLKADELKAIEAIMRGGDLDIGVILPRRPRPTRRPAAEADASSPASPSPRTPAAPVFEELPHAEVMSVFDRLNRMADAEEEGTTETRMLSFEELTTGQLRRAPAAPNPPSPAQKTASPATAPASTPPTSTLPSPATAPSVTPAVASRFRATARPRADGQTANAPTPTAAGPTPVPASPGQTPREPQARSQTADQSDEEGHSSALHVETAGLPLAPENGGVAEAVNLGQNQPEAPVPNMDRPDVDQTRSGATPTRLSDPVNDASSAVQVAEQEPQPEPPRVPEISLPITQARVLTNAAEQEAAPEPLTQAPASPATEAASDTLSSVNLSGAELLAAATRPLPAAQLTDGEPLSVAAPTLPTVAAPAGVTSLGLVQERGESTETLRVALLPDVPSSSALPLSAFLPPRPVPTKSRPQADEQTQPNATNASAGAKPDLTPLPLPAVQGSVLDLSQNDDAPQPIQARQEESAVPAVVSAFQAPPTLPIVRASSTPSDLPSVYTPSLMPLSAPMPGPGLSMPTFPAPVPQVVSAPQVAVAARLTPGASSSTATRFPEARDVGMVPVTQPSAQGLPTSTPLGASVGRSNLAVAGPTVPALQRQAVEARQARVQPTETQASPLLRPEAMRPATVAEETLGQEPFWGPVPPDPFGQAMVPSADAPSALPTPYSSGPLALQPLPALLPPLFAFPEIAPAPYLSGPPPVGPAWPRLGQLQPDRAPLEQPQLGRGVPQQALEQVSVRNLNTGILDTENLILPQRPSVNVEGTRLIQAQAASSMVGAPLPATSLPAAALSPTRPPASLPLSAFSAPLPMLAPAAFSALAPSVSRQMANALGVRVNDIPVVQHAGTQPILDQHRAEALTVGDTVILGPNVNLSSPSGLGVLAHELTHALRARRPDFVPQLLQTAPDRSGKISSLGEETLALRVEGAVRASARGQGQPGRQNHSEAPVHSLGISPSSSPAVQATRTRPVSAAPPRPAPTGFTSSAGPNTAAPARLPAPWEPMPFWEDNTKYASAAAPAFQPSALPASPPPAASPSSGPAPVYAASTDRQVTEPAPPPPPALPSPSPSAAPASSPSSPPVAATSRQPSKAQQPDLDLLAQQVYGVLKRRLETELRRRT